MSTAEENGRVAGTQSISRAFAMLRLFCTEGGSLGVVQLAGRLELTLSTTHRIARALVAEGYLAQDEGRERYRFGPQSLLLGHAAHRALGIDVARPVLERLAAHTEESINLGLLDGDHAIVIERVESSQRLRFSMEVGARIELHATSMGKSLLAFNDELTGYVDGLDDDLVQLTTKTHATVKSLRADLGEIRARGWSTDDEESLVGVRCVAAPVLDTTGQAKAAVAVQAPAVRMPDERFDELGPVVRSAAFELASLLPI
ncbi:MAG: helix-turn-helix domain-containing protein [Actinophytocola sp.]|nr:helix-turn-helix domain-containing protein [Actinophytocola sp.]